MNTAVAFSPDWAKVALIHVFTLFANNPPPITALMVSDNVDDTPNMSGICEYFGPGYNCICIGVEMLYKQRIVSDINVSNRYPRCVLYPLLLPEIVNEDRLLFLAADTVVNGGLTDLYDLDMGNNLLAGVIDYGVEGGNHKESIGLTGYDQYINAGVVLMNLSEIRDKCIGEQWIYHANNQSYSLPDQDIMNITCKGRIKTVDVKYNVGPPTRLDGNDIRVAHFSGGERPWRKQMVANFHIWRHWVEEYERVFQTQLTGLLPEPANGEATHLPELQEPVSGKMAQLHRLIPEPVGSKIILRHRTMKPYGLR